MKSVAYNLKFDKLTMWHVNNSDIKELSMMYDFHGSFLYTQLLAELYHVTGEKVRNKPASYLRTAIATVLLLGLPFSSNINGPYFNCDSWLDALLNLFLNLLTTF